MKLIELDQQTVEWLEWRHEGLGASDAPAIMNQDKYQTRDQLLERKKIRLSRGSDNPNQAFGKAMEPLIRDKYIQQTGIQVRPICIVHDSLHWLRASLDGLSLDNDLAIEIKATNAKYHEQALSGKIPDQFWPQIQHQFLVSLDPENVPQIRQIDLLSYNSSRKFPLSKQLARVKVYPNREYLDQLLIAETQFRREMGKGRPGIT